ISLLAENAFTAHDAQSLPCAIRSDRGPRQNAVSDPSAHAATWLRLCSGQRRPPHAGTASLAGAQEHSTHGARHRAVAASVQRLLALIVGDRGIDDASVQRLSGGCVRHLVLSPSLNMPEA